jgi:hypothetical protein
VLRRDGLEIYFDGSSRPEETVPWDQTSTDYDTLKALEAVPVQAWTGSWDGEVTVIEAPSPVVIGSELAYVAYGDVDGLDISMDGMTWESRELPVPGARVVNVQVVSGGFVSQISLEARDQLWYADENLINWRPIMLPAPVGDARLWARDSGRGAVFILATGQVLTMPDGRQLLRGFFGDPRWILASADGLNWLVETEPEGSAERFGSSLSLPAVANGAVVVPTSEDWFVYSLP